MIFYESQLGLYPYIDIQDASDYEESSNPADGSNQNPATNDTIRFVNGGLPQNADLRAHLEKARADILKAIPDPDFAGPAVIDYEKWRPEWSLNWAARRVYQLESTRDALARFLGISEKSALELGRELFNKRARQVS